MPRKHTFAAPKLPYEPAKPRRYNPPIGLIGCGEITRNHLQAYRDAGLNVVALCNRHPGPAEARRREFYPEARIYSDYRDVLARGDIEVVDIATHPAHRAPIIEAALKARKHVLSQKPFVTDLNVGRRLADLADRRGVRLAVNQNARWAPHFSYIRAAIEKDLVGQVLSAHMAVHWDHDWVAKTPFNEVPDLILFDFAVHWFDLVRAFLPGKEAKRVYASKARAAGQKSKPPLLAQAVIEYEGAQASLVFDGFTKLGPLDETYVAGTKGTLLSRGPDVYVQKVTLFTRRGEASPRLRGCWFPDGFRGTMGELLRAIEEGREPTNGARDNLHSLALCFAACRSAETGKPQTPGKVPSIASA